MEAHGLKPPMQKTLYSREYQQMLKLLREKRLAAQVSQAELADRLEWTQAEVSKCETGVRRVDVIELKLWLEALGNDLSGFVLELYGEA
jgi:transcriptional regulator with XRE-family HTH domain